MTDQMKDGLPEKEGNLKRGLNKGFVKKEIQEVKQPTTKEKLPEKEIKTEKPQAQKETKKEFDPWSVLLYPHLAEKSMAMVENGNKLTFFINRKATKKDIRQAIEKGFNVQVEKVNVEITRKGVKKAYVKLSPKHQAADIATRLGMI